jgi:general stress protein 26
MGKIELVARFLASPGVELLTEDAFFQALARTSGRDAVVRHFAAHEVYRKTSWSAPQADGDRVKVTGGGLLLLFELAGGRIAAIRQQALAGAPPTPATPVKLTDELKKLVDNALATRHPMIVAYVDAAGQPILSFRGSTQSFSDDQLAIWVRNSDGNFLNAIAKNPKVALMYRDEDTKATYQFQGRARVTSDEAVRQRIYAKMAEAERNHDPARTGVALLVDLDRVEGWAGMSPNGPVNKVRMLRETGN